MLSSDYYPWLIEINCSPAMESSTSVTARLCRQVLEDTLKGKKPVMYNVMYISVLPSILKACRPYKPSAQSFSLMWERKAAKSFDVTAGHAQTTPSHHALNYSWGEHCICYSHFYHDVH